MPKPEPAFVRVRVTPAQKRQIRLICAQTGERGISEQQYLATLIERDLARRARKEQP